MSVWYLGDEDLGCDGGNKTVVKLQNDENLNQVRWGMRIDADGFDDSTIVEEINYVSKQITLNKAYVTAPNPNKPEITFHGDRNLNFSPERNITGINFIDGMLFWTDNYSEPKKIDIKRCKAGSKTSLWSTTPGLIGRYTGLPIPKIDDFNQHTVLVIGDEIKYDCIKDDLICGTPQPGSYQQTTKIDDN